jgi:hypothetical protein
MKKYSFLGFAFIVLFSACEKISDKEPCVLKNVEIITNSPVIVGWPINISTRASQSDVFRWVGPNGVFANQGGNSIQVLDAKYSDSGSYKVEIKNAFDCLEFESYTNIKVIPPPSAPCTVTNNTSTSTVIGVGDNTYTYVSFTNNNADAYPVIANSNNALHFRFYGSTPPKPGLYKTGDNTGFNAIDKVACWISTFPATEFRNKENQNVYVTKVNGKYVISFCNAEFTNPIGSSVIKISAKITEP